MDMADLQARKGNRLSGTSGCSPIRSGRSLRAPGRPEAAERGLDGRKEGAGIAIQSSAEVLALPRSGVNSFGMADLAPSAAIAA
jgi:hypothetical protein